MGSRGPAPTPTNLRLVRGGHPERVNHDEPLPKEREITCPEWVGAMGKTLWRQLAPDLIEAGVLTYWDRELFATGCHWYHTYRRAMQLVEKEGFATSGARGVVKNPNLQAAKDAFEALNRVFARFGMTPSDRAQLKIGGHHRGADAERLLS